MAALSALREFSHSLVLRLQRLSPLRGCTAAMVPMVERQQWAVSKASKLILGTLTIKHELQLGDLYEAVNYQLISCVARSREARDTKKHDSLE